MLLLTLAFTGCIKEDIDDCPPVHNVVLNFSYYYHNSYTNLFSEKVENVGIYVYDADGEYVTSFFKDEKDFLLTPAQALIFLKPGTYSLVCWGNVFNHTDIRAGLVGQPLSVARVFHAGSSRATSDNGDPLFYAPRMSNLYAPDTNILTLTVPETETVVQNVDFTATHKTVEVVVEGFLDNGSICPTVVVSNQPLAYNFRMQPIVGGSMEYRQRAVEEQWTAKYGVATFYLPLFEMENNVLIQVIRPSNGVVMHSINLQQYLADNHITLTSLDWDLLTIHVVFNDVGAVISVEPWNGNNITPGK